MEIIYRRFDFGDYRLNERARKIQARLEVKSSISFPGIFKKYRDLEGFYRFINNPKVGIDELTEPLIDEAVGILKELKKTSYLVLHDTTIIEPESVNNVEGLFPLYQKGNGFLAHFSIAVGGFSEKRILGLMGLKLWTREKKRKGEKRSKVIQGDPERESRRWIEQIRYSEKAHGVSGELIHVMDREADAYWMFDEMKLSGFRFVTRLVRDRPIQNKQSRATVETVRDVLNKCETVFTREVELSLRDNDGKGLPKILKRHPSRQARKAVLSVRAGKVTVKRSQSSSIKESPFLDLNIVEVFEEHPPEGERGIEWKLATSERIDCKEDLEKIVDSYRARWIIEEFFKALKTGCQFEKRQFESAQAWYNCLGVFIPIAMKIYNLREDAKIPDKIDSQLNSVQKKILLSRLKKETKPTSENLIRAIAELGGHIKYNGPPGWLTLMRGFEELLTLEQGYRLARSDM